MESPRFTLALILHHLSLRCLGGRVEGCFSPKTDLGGKLVAGKMVRDPALRRSGRLKRLYQTSIALWA